MSAKVAHKIFHEHYSPEVTVSVDSLNQLAGRIRRTQPPDIILAVNKESWAISPRSVASEEVSHGMHRSKSPTLANYL